MSFLSNLLPAKASKPNRGKYPSYLRYRVAKAIRDWQRLRIARLVSWQPLLRPEPGCTAIIGMCSKLPGILPANLACLDRYKWADLRRVLVAVDDERGCLPPG